MAILLLLALVVLPGVAQAAVEERAAAACVPSERSTTVNRDFDGDGVSAFYLKYGTTQVTVWPDGTLTAASGPYHCWSGGDLDDDGHDRTASLDGAAPSGGPVDGPTASVCVHAESTRVVAKDYDGDGMPATYARSDNRQLDVHSDGSITTALGTYDCWIAGDLDDDGEDRTPFTAPAPVPSRSLCFATSETYVIQEDKDVDGVDASYTRGFNLRAYLRDDGELRFIRGGDKDCWAAGDPDDDKPNHGQEVFAFGDSITATGRPLARDGSDAYVHDIDPEATSGHNRDGSGRSSEWGAAMLAHHSPITGTNRLFVIEFGQNDRRPDRGSLTAAETATNLERMYDGALEHADHALVLLPLLIDPASTWPAWSDSMLPLPAQHAWLLEIEAGLAARGIPFVRTYDLLDSQPGNGVPDGWVPTYYVDDVHPTAAGHERIGQAIAAFAQQQGWALRAPAEPLQAPAPATGASLSGL